MIHNRSLLVFALAALVASALSAQTAPPPQVQSLAIVQRYVGPAKMPVVDDTASERDPLVIRSQDEFAAFVQLLPTREINKNKNPGPSRDSLVSLPRIDWNRLMMLVVFDVQTISFPPQIQKVDLVRDKVIVTLRYRDNKDVIETKELALGSYTAVLVMRSELPVVFTTTTTGRREGASAAVIPHTPDMDK